MSYESEVFANQVTWLKCKLMIIMLKKVYMVQGTND